MNAPAIKGWCPGALRPMESGDGLIVRLKITGGIVPLDLAARIADWSAQWGNGEIDLTSRVNLQLRGVSERNLPGLHAVLEEDGLLDGNADGEAVRNVIASPLAGVDPDALLDVRPLVKELEDRLAGDLALHRLPAKFGFAIDDGGWFGLRDVSADIRFEAVAGSAFEIHLDGADEGIGLCGPDKLVDVAAALARGFLRCRVDFGSDVRRMRDLVARIGAEAIANEASLALKSTSPLEGEVGAKRRVGGMVQPPRNYPICGTITPHPSAKAPPTSPSRGEALGPVVIGVGLPFGRIAAEQLTRLADSATVLGAHELRLTPWRTIFIPMPSTIAAQTLYAELADTGLIFDPADPRLHVAACAGQPSCLHATTKVREDAAHLAAFATKAPGITLHVSGCAKGCAHPRPAPVTLVGRDGKYDLIRDGAPSDSPLLRGLTLDEAAGYLREMANPSQGGTA
jgi:precorrin-3B synthase